MPGDETSAPYVELLQAWEDLLRRAAAAGAGALDGGRVAQDASGAMREAPVGRGDSATEALFAEIAAALMASSARSGAALSEAWARLLPLLERGVRGAGGDPRRAVEAREALIDELRAALHAVTDLSRQAAEELHLEFERIVLRGSASVDHGQAAVPDPGTYWRRWTVKP